ncbi:MAG TPA: hypothetical protein VJG32_19430 [Anaerolineae bacterium]|nr:hypothetical protein [Anaerolineae bacterium]
MSAAFNSTFFILHSTFFILHSTFFILHSTFSPALHGQLGVVDELLLFCLPGVVAFIVLAFAAQRARQKEERARSRSRAPADRMTEHGPPPTSTP